MDSPNPSVTIVAPGPVPAKLPALDRIRPRESFGHPRLSRPEPPGLNAHIGGLRQYSELVREGVRRVKRAGEAIRSNEQQQNSHVSSFMVPSDRVE